MLLRLSLLRLSYSALTCSILSCSILSLDSLMSGFGQSVNAQQTQRGETEDAVTPNKFLSNVRQITFDGLRAGEGYFGSGSDGGNQMVFQSERREDNPFFQIYTLDFETGDTEPVSPGYGKTTCAWLHPDGNRVLFASTQFDSDAKQKQLDELAFRESGQTRRYSWDYDPTYELVAYDRENKTYQRLTNAEGYDAEASYSPDGKLIAFASNRAAYATR